MRSSPVRSRSIRQEWSKGGKFVVTYSVNGEPEKREEFDTSSQCTRFVEDLERQYPVENRAGSDFAEFGRDFLRRLDH